MALKRVTDTQPLWQTHWPHRVGGAIVCDAACGVLLSETALTADLGGSSTYSNESFENRSGEWFHVNNIWTWVSRS